jgi:predicted nucleotidyltransferase
MNGLTIESIEGRKKERRALLQSALSGVVRQLEKMGARKIVLFGSMVEGHLNSGSDLDILVVMPPDRPGREWMRHIYRELERDVATDILVFNITEFEEELKSNAFLQQVMKKGRVLLEKDS